MENAQKNLIGKILIRVVVNHREHPNEQRPQNEISFQDEKGSTSSMVIGSRSVSR